MHFKLNKDPKRIAYSDTDKRLFALLNGKPRSTTELAEAFYQGSEQRPVFYENAFRATVSAFIRKIDANGEPFMVLKSARRGSQPSTYSLVERKPRRATA